METMSNHLPNLDEEKLKFVIELKEKGHEQQKQNTN